MSKSEEKKISCTIKALPDRLLKKASQVAVKINGANAPVLMTMGSSASLMSPEFLTILTSKYW